MSLQFAFGNHRLLTLASLIMTSSSLTATNLDAKKVVPLKLAIAYTGTNTCKTSKTSTSNGSDSDINTEACVSFAANTGPDMSTSSYTTRSSSVGYRLTANQALPQSLESEEFRRSGNFLGEFPIMAIFIFSEYYIP
ncbi:hypothetical protein V1511DRAFT_533046 [Dipodascopsis uninucleata]